MTQRRDLEVHTVLNLSNKSKEHLKWSHTIFFSRALLQPANQKDSYLLFYSEHVSWKLDFFFSQTLFPTTSC